MRKTVCIAFIILVLAVVLQFAEDSFGEASDETGALSGSSGSKLVFQYRLRIISISLPYIEKTDDAGKQGSTIM
jgi:hypothetical protein